MLLENIDFEKCLYIINERIARVDNGVATKEDFETTDKQRPLWFCFKFIKGSSKN